MKRALKIACVLPVIVAMAVPLGVSGRVEQSIPQAAPQASSVKQLQVPAADVFLVDDDLGNQQGSQCINYESIYSDTIQSLGLTDRYWETGIYGSPAWLLQQPVIQSTQYTTTTTGYVTPFSTATANRLTVVFTGVTRCGRVMNWNTNGLQYLLDSGGRVLVFSQDAMYYNNLYSTTPMTPALPYDAAKYFGADFVQDAISVPSVENDTSALYLSGQSGNIGQPNSSVDQMAVATSNADGDAAAIFRNGADLSQVIGVKMSSEPTIERVKSGTWHQLPYRTELLSFGLETLPDASSRAVLLDRLTSFLLDEVSVSLSGEPLVAYADTPVNLHADATTSVTETKTMFQNAIVQYRWDFGDGTPIQTGTGPDVSHTYAQEGKYQAYVEVTDKFGHKAVRGAMVIVGRMVHVVVPPGGIRGTLNVADNSTVDLDFPAGTFGADNTVTVTMGITGGIPPSGTLNFLGSAFFVEARDGAGNFVQPTSPVTLTLTYSDADAASLFTPRMQLYVWNGTLGVWEAVPGTLDLANHQLTVVLDHFSIYSVQAPVVKKAFLPVVQQPILTYTFLPVVQGP